MIRLKVGKLLADREQTAYWLAKEAHITIPVAYRLAAGDVRRLDLDTLSKVCKALGVQPGDLMEYRGK